MSLIDVILTRPLALTEPNATAVLLLTMGLLIASSVLFSRSAERLGIPIILLFFVLGMLGGSEGIGRIPFEDYQLTSRVGTIALVLILFDGGLNTSMGSVRQVLYPSGALATAGVLLTAALTALFARLLGLPWDMALLLGAIISSTDAAAVFAVLRGGRISLRPDVGRTIEVESCINDPMAVILTTSMLQAIGNPRFFGIQSALNVPIQFAVGAGIGIMLGYIGRALLARVRVATVGLYPALTLGLAIVSYSGATLVQGSGFLAVYVTGLILGASPYMPYRAGLHRIHDALAWLSQIAIFVMLGLLVFPSRLLAVAPVGLAVGLFLAVIARPVAVWLCLLPFRIPSKKINYIGWMGLRGAVPIILATFPVLEGVHDGQRIFDIVCFVVVLSSLIPGATIRPVTRWMDMGVPERPLPPAVLEINSSHRLSGELASFFIEPSVAVAGAALRDVEFPPGAAVVLVVRGEELIAARGSTVLQAGDHVYIFYHPEDRPFIELLFGLPEENTSGGLAS